MVFRVKTDLYNKTKVQCLMFIIFVKQELLSHKYNRFSRLHRFSRLPLKKPIAVLKQKPRALLHWLRFFFFDRLHAPIFFRYFYYFLMLQLFNQIVSYTRLLIAVQKYLGMSECKSEQSRLQILAFFSARFSTVEHVQTIESFLCDVINS